MKIYTGYNDDGDEICEYESYSVCKQTPGVVEVWSHDPDACGMAAQPKKVWSKDE